MIRLCLLADEVTAIIRHLAGSHPAEEGCAILLREARGQATRRLVASSPIFPDADAWEGQGESHLRPTARWLSQLVSAAFRARAGLLFIHSHPDPGFPQGLSGADRRAMRALAGAVGPILDGPIGALVVHPDGWSGALVEDGEFHEFNRISSIGQVLDFLNPPPPEDPADGEIDDRQARTMGAHHRKLRDLDVAGVGQGGLGSPISEALTRMGVRSVALIDSGRLDDPSNVRRVTGSRMADLDTLPPPPKVDVVAAHLRGIGLNTKVAPVFADVTEEATWRALLDFDIVVCSTDNHTSRAVLNELVSRYLLPVVDVGARAGCTTDGALAALAAEVRVLTPSTPCLWCRDVLSPFKIRQEGLPDAERRRLASEGYLVDGDGPEPSIAALTTLGAGLAASVLVGLLGPPEHAPPATLLVDPLVGYGFEPTSAIDPDCRCRRQVAMADDDGQPNESQLRAV